MLTWNLIWWFDDLQTNHQINIRQYEFSKYYKPWHYIILSNWNSPYAFVWLIHQIYFPPIFLAIRYVYMNIATSLGALTQMTYVHVT